MTNGPRSSRPPSRKARHGENHGSAINEAPLAPTPLSTTDAAAYIAEMSDELASLARNSKLDLLAYLLQMAADEARATARSSLGGE
jgi:hypothetical protein